MKVLITGGAGYIGSTIASCLEEHNHVPVILDSLVRGKREFIHDRHFYEGDIGNVNLINRIFADHPDIWCTIHCAALADVLESIQEPANYYYNNVSKSIRLLQALLSNRSHRIVFSSTAAVYGSSQDIVVTEESSLSPQSPYARSKLMIEAVLQDLASFSLMRSITLRYFNPIGADPKLRSGNSKTAAMNVLAKLIAASIGKGEVFRIYGTDWPTRDGTAMRDYVHVWDLAEAHVMAVEKFDWLSEAPIAGQKNGFRLLNLGSGTGVTVNELIQAFEEEVGKTLRKVHAPRRDGDIAGASACTTLAYEYLGWSPKKTLHQGIADELKWAKTYQLH